MPLRINCSDQRHPKECLWASVAVVCRLVSRRELLARQLFLTISLTSWGALYFPGVNARQYGVGILVSVSAAMRLTRTPENT